MARLSTHVLDTGRGSPPRHRVSTLPHHRRRRATACAAAVTNADGRTDEPLLSGDRIPAGIYELVFHAGDYFRGMGVP